MTVWFVKSVVLYQTPRSLDTTTPTLLLLLSRVLFITHTAYQYNNSTWYNTAVADEIMHCLKCCPNDRNKKDNKQKDSKKNKDRQTDGYDSKKKDKKQKDAGIKNMDFRGDLRHGFRQQGVELFV